MSVVTGRPHAILTCSRMRSPASTPGPRKDSRLVRFALSNDALKTSCTGRSAVICRRRSAIASVSGSFSITQGPAISNRACPSPQR